MRIALYPVCGIEHFSTRVIEFRKSTGIGNGIDVTAMVQRAIVEKSGFTKCT
jgi:hypothetical protein